LPYEETREIIEGKLYVPINRKNWYIHNEGNNSIKPVQPTRLQQLFSNTRTYIANSIACEAIYRPHDRNRLVDRDTSTHKGLNTYNPPTWKKKWFDGKSKGIEAKPLPPQYKEFLEHLTGSHKESYEFILDWLAISLTSTNKTFLCTIGDPGVGKGTLARIIKKLHGDSNTSWVKLDSINKQFNKNFGNKTFLYLDEAGFVDSKTNDKLKMLNGEDIELELKGVDAETVENYANVCISSNSLESLEFDEKDRRMSIVNLTSERFDLKFAYEPTTAALLNDENIADFAAYLWNRKYNVKNISVAFRDKRAKEMQNSRVLDWQRVLLKEYALINAGKDVRATEVVDYFRENMGTRINISTKTLRALAKRFPGVYNVHSKNMTDTGSGMQIRPDVLTFYTKEEQTPYDLKVDEE